MRIRSAILSFIYVQVLLLSLFDGLHDTQCRLVTKLLVVTNGASQAGRGQQSSNSTCTTYHSGLDVAIGSIKPTHLPWPSLFAKNVPIVK